VQPTSDNESRHDPDTELKPPEQATEDVVAGLRALSGSSEASRQDRRAEIYDELYEIRQPCFRYYEDWIAEAVYSAWYEGRGRLLVVGCGTGTLLQRLALRMPAKLITGIDASPQMARRAREKVPAVPEIRTVPFESYQPVVPFDVVVFNGVLAAMPDLHSTAEHTAAMTLHGSRVVICVRNGEWKARPGGHPSWYWRRWINRGRIAEIAQMTEPVRSPHAALTAGKIFDAFGGRFGLRDQRSAFGVMRLFEDVIAVPREQALQTVGLTREWRPWMGVVDRLRRLDEAFAKRHPMGGGLLAMLLDKLH
jgi:SAM-dependent methyltransferase